MDFLENLIRFGRRVASILIDLLEETDVDLLLVVADIEKILLDNSGVSYDYVTDEENRESEGNKF